MTKYAPWHREPMVWMVIAIPSTAVLVGMIMLTLSLKFYDGLVADDYYKRGLAINQTLERQRQAESLGLNAVIDLLLEQNKIEVMLRGNQQFLYPPTLSFSLRHSTRADHDQIAILTHTGNGAYVGEIRTIVPGRWYLQLNTANWRLFDVIHWPTNGGEIKLGQ